MVGGSVDCATRLNWRAFGMRKGGAMRCDAKLCYSMRCYAKRCYAKRSEDGESVRPPRDDANLRTDVDTDGRGLM